MISFDLRCGEGHVFEGWFGSSQDFEDQKARGLLTCPQCGDAHVAKALMAPNVASKKETVSAAPSPADLTPERMMVMLRGMRKKIEQNADYVGPSFAEEARKIHYGDAEARDIYGESTPEESDALEAEGIEFARVPWVPDMDN